MIIHLEPSFWKLLWLCFVPLLLFLSAIFANSLSGSSIKSRGDGLRWTPLCLFQMVSTGLFFVYDGFLNLSFKVFFSTEFSFIFVEYAGGHTGRPLQRAFSKITQQQEKNQHRERNLGHEFSLVFV